MAAPVIGEGMSAEERQRYIGGSDVAAIAGLSPYRTALDVYAEKKGLAAPFEGNEFTYWGKELEDVVLACDMLRATALALLPVEIPVGAETTRIGGRT